MHEMFGRKGRVFAVTRCTYGVIGQLFGAFNTKNTMIDYDQDMTKVQVGLDGRTHQLVNETNSHMLNEINLKDMQRFGKTS